MRNKKKTAAPPVGPTDAPKGDSIPTEAPAAEAGAPDPEADAADDGAAAAAKLSELEGKLANATAKLVEKDDEIAGLRENAVGLLNEIAALQVESDVEVGELIGTIASPHDLFVLSDTFFLDQKWPYEPNSGWVCDIKGENAKYLAHRQKHYKTEELADGTWRVHLPHNRAAMALSSDARKLIATNEWHDKVEFAALKAKTQMAKDVVRGPGVGLVAHEGRSAYIAFSGKQARVYASKDGDDKVTAVVIKID